MTKQPSSVTWAAVYRNALLLAIDRYELQPISLHKLSYVRTACWSQAISIKTRWKSMLFRMNYCFNLVKSIAAKPNSKRRALWISFGTSQSLPKHYMHWIYKNSPCIGDYFATHRWLGQSVINGQNFLQTNFFSLNENAKWQSRIVTTAAVLPRLFACSNVWRAPMTSDKTTCDTGSVITATLFSNG